MENKNHNRYLKLKSKQPQIKDVIFYQTCKKSYDKKEKHSDHDSVITKIKLSNPVKKKNDDKFPTLDKFTDYIKKNIKNLTNQYTGRLYVHYYEYIPNIGYRRCKREIDKHGDFTGVAMIEGKEFKTYVGYCKEGKLNGKGNLLCTDDTRIIGKWENDKLIEGRVLCTDGCNIDVFEDGDSNMTFMLNDVDVSIFMNYEVENNFDFRQSGKIMWEDEKGNKIIYEVQTLWLYNTAVDGKLTILHPNGKVAVEEENFNMNREELSSLLQQKNVIEYLDKEPQFVKTIRERKDWAFKKSKQEKNIINIFPKYEIIQEPLNNNMDSIQKKNYSALDNLSSIIPCKDKESESSYLIGKSIPIKKTQNEYQGLISNTEIPSKNKESESSDCFCGCLKQCRNISIKETEIPLITTQKKSMDNMVFERK